MTPKREMKTGAILALSIVVLMMSSGLATAQTSEGANTPETLPGEDIDYTREQIEVVNDLEGGEIILTLGEARMEVSYGDGRITMETTQKKYMGIADVYDDRRGFSQRLGIPTYSVFYQKLVGVGEYVDENENGLFDVTGPKVAGTIEELEDVNVNHEQLLKWVDFNDVDWQITEWVQSVNGNDVEIDFVLSAENIAYANDTGAVDGVQLERLAYIFHVTTVEEQIAVEAVPHYRVFADEEGEVGNRIDSSEMVAQTDVTGHVLNSTWKYDQVVEGWDIAQTADGVVRNDTRLVVLTELAYGVHLDDRVGEWMREQFGGLVSPKAIAGHAPRKLASDHMPDMGDLMGGDSNLPQHPPKMDHDKKGHPLECGLAYTGDAAAMHTDTSARGRAMNDQESERDASSDNESRDDQKSEEKKRQEMVLEKMKAYHDTACMQRGEVMQMNDEARPEAIRAGAIHFDDNGANLGRIRWVSNATVDGVETEVLFQTHGARPVTNADVDGRDGMWSGVRIVGAYNYVLGEVVYHDPEFSTDVLTLDTQSFDDPFVYDGGNFARLIQRMVRILPLALGIIVLSVVGIVVASSRSRRQQAPLPSQKQYVPAGAWASDDDWSQYQP